MFDANGRYSESLDPRDYLPIEDGDLDSCRDMMWAVITRAFHDACGATVTETEAVSRQHVAVQARHWLTCAYGDAKADRWRICEFVNLDPELFDERVAMAQIPEPTLENMRNSWSNLEMVYWRMGGSIGDPPKPRPERLDGRKLTRTTREERTSAIVPRRTHAARPPSMATQPVAPRWRRLELAIMSFMSPA